VGVETLERRRSRSAGELLDVRERGRVTRAQSGEAFDEDVPGNCLDVGLDLLSASRAVEGMCAPRAPRAVPRKRRASATVASWPCQIGQLAKPRKIRT
jgi:hypothetical protein